MDQQNNDEREGHKISQKKKKTKKKQKNETKIKKNSFSFY